MLRPQGDIGVCIILLNEEGSTDERIQVGPFLNKINYKKVGDTVVELDQYKYELSTFEKPLLEVRASL